LSSHERLFKRSFLVTASAVDFAYICCSYKLNSSEKGEFLETKEVDQDAMESEYGGKLKIDYNKAAELFSSEEAKGVLIFSSLYRWLVLSP